MRITEEKETLSSYHPSSSPVDHLSPGRTRFNPFIPSHSLSGVDHLSPGRTRFNPFIPSHSSSLADPSLSRPHMVQPLHSLTFFMPTRSTCLPAAHGSPLSQIGTDGWFSDPKGSSGYRNVLVWSSILITCDIPPPRKEKVCPKKFRPPLLGIEPEQSRSCVRQKIL